jgi:hypothetical protein
VGEAWKRGYYIRTARNYSDLAAGIILIIEFNFLKFFAERTEVGVTGVAGVQELQTILPSLEKHLCKGTVRLMSVLQKLLNYREVERMRNLNQVICGVCAVRGNAGGGGDGNGTEVLKFVI